MLEKLRILLLGNVTKRLQELQIENDLLRQELLKRQDAINKTNAYWKGVLRKVNRTNR